MSQTFTFTKDFIQILAFTIVSGDSNNRATFQGYLLISPPLIFKSQEVHPGWVKTLQQKVAG
jgi:hypothetical protein